jgi:hypothetical protein
MNLDNSEMLQKLKTNLSKAENARLETQLQTKQKDELIAEVQRICNTYPQQFGAMAEGIGSIHPSKSVFKPLSAMISFECFTQNIQRYIFTKFLRSNGIR